MAALTGLESLLALRYLRLERPRRASVYLPALVLLVVNVAIRLAWLWLDRHRTGMAAFSPWRVALDGYLRWGGLLAAMLLVLCLFLTWLVRHYTIFTSISTFGLFLGSAALVVVLSVMSGFEQDLKHKILGANAHVLVTSPDQPFTDYRRLAVTLAALPAVDSVMPYLANEVMVSSQANLAGVILKGIDPEAAARVTDLGTNLEQGKLDNLSHPELLRDLESPIEVVDPAEPPDPDAPRRPAKGEPPLAELVPGGQGAAPKQPAADAAPDAARPHRRLLPGVLVGRELARNLRLFLGDDVNIISPMGDIGPSGPIPRSRAFRVAGIFYSGMYEYDTKNIYMTIAAAQKFLSLDDEVTGLEIRVRDPDRTDRVVGAIGAALGEGAARYEVKDWQALNRNLFSALKVEKIAMFIVLCFIILVAGFSIIANGIMLVREKEQEIAILKSMGATDRSILKTFLYIGAYMGGVGIGVGIATGVAVCLALARFGLTLDSDVYYIARLPVELNPWEIAAVFLASMSIALLATLYPALEAARLRPVEGLRYDRG
jgi:lipoprotein-releasing system permease protein